MIPKNRQQILKYATSKNIVVIEDLAHGFHLEIGNKQPIKGIEESVKLLSFGRSKLLSAVHGGALIVPDKYNTVILKKLYASLDYPSTLFIIKALLYKIITPVIKMSYGFILGKLLHKLLLLLGLFTQEITASEKAGRYDAWLEKKLPAALARLLIKQVDTYPQTVAERVAKANKISKGIGVSFSSSQPLLRYPLIVKDRHLVSAKLAKETIVVGNWYTQPVAPESLDLNVVAYSLGSCTKAEQVCNQILNLPLDITQKQVQVVREVLHETQSKA